MDYSFFYTTVNYKSKMRKCVFKLNIKDIFKLKKSQNFIQ